MPSPFPGMDPYLETPDRWRNVHDNLATEIQAQLAPLIRPRYYADQEPRFVYDTGVDVVTKHQALPDVSVVEHPRPTPLSHSAAAIAPAPLEVLITTDLPEKLASVVIRTVEGDTISYRHRNSVFCQQTPWPCRLPDVQTQASGASGIDGAPARN